MKHLDRAAHRFQAVLYGGAVAAIAAFSGLGYSSSSIAQGFFQDSPKMVLDEAWQLVNRQFVDSKFNGVDWQAVRQDLLSQDYASPEAAYAALRDALEQLDDPYTRFYDPREYQSLGTQVYGEISGIGIRLQVDEATQQLTILETLANTPASEAGIEAGDRVVAVDGKSTSGLDVEAVSRLIQGEIGTDVTLRLQRPNQAPFDVTLTRAPIELETVHYEVKQEGGSRIGYIQLDSFSSNSPVQMQSAIQALLDQKVDGFVLDLRDNGGGSLQAAIEISRMWLNRGTIVQTVDRVGDRESITANQTALTQLPLAVLVNEQSASASEILAGAMMDNRRATIVGTQTYGKALVQQLHPLADGSALTVTIAHYYTPNGTDISHRGITPNVVANVTDSEQQQLATNEALRGAAADSQYQRAIDTLQARASLRQSS